MDTVLIETPRLFLREQQKSDLSALCEVFCDPETMQHYPHPFDEAEVQSWIERNQQRYQMFGFGLWAVCLRETGEVIGDCGLTMQNIGGTIKPEIGYHIRRDQQGRGYATEAACAVRDWVFRNTPFRELYSYMKYTNMASARTAVAYGCSFAEAFADEGNGRTRVYRITREAWNSLVR